jgi:hypothetical protein
MTGFSGPSVNLSEEEIRLELLKLSHISLHEEYNFNREQQTWVWDAKVRNCLSNNTPVPEHPGYPSHPTDKDVVKRAKLFADFIFSEKK